MLMAFIAQATSQTIYVSQNGSGKGASWADATGSLSWALANAKPGVQVWVAEGTYSPVGGGRNASFNIPAKVQVLGGFKGFESNASERNPSVNKTILSGEIGTPGIADNTFNVVTLENTATLDGFTITAGNANKESAEGEKTRCGGAIFIMGNLEGVSPRIVNCTIKGNRAMDGAGVYVNGRNAACNPVFENCYFTENEAALDGGAIYSDGRLNGKSNLILTNCTFEKNMGTYGGAICNATESGVCNLTMEKCSFKENAAYLRGGALFSLNGTERCYLEMNDCSLVGNYPDDQNMIFTNNDGRSKAYQVLRSNP
jgi:predicted outer membrane repeat protein